MPFQRFFGHPQPDISFAKGNAVLVEFRVKNYRSFRDETVLSLVAASERDQSHPDNLIRQDKFDLLKTAAIYGANASGKSNLIKALGTMQAFVRDSATKMNAGDAIPGVAPFRLCRELQRDPTTFEVTGILEDGLRFEYGFSATAQRVHDEWLVAYPRGKAAHWLERCLNPETGETKWTFRGPLGKTEGAMLRERTRENGLVLSRGAQENCDPLESIYRWFRNRIRILDLSDFGEMDVAATLTDIYDDPDLRTELVSLVQQADFGIDNLIAQKLDLYLDRLPESTRDELTPELVQEMKQSFTLYSLRALHQMDDGTGVEAFNFSKDESLGTQRFLTMASLVLKAIKCDALLVVDELECSMHPLLTRKLIELFQSPRANPGRAQLVFATHDTSLFDSELLRRDQILLVEKRRDGASELFSLFDIKERPRHDTAFERNYLAGRYGAVPSFGPIFENLELK
ncbi:MAG: AAA family ATPase [Pirellulales bacterium]|nr:AAA family ATPase [Pirellulales bacterium]